MNRVDLVGRLCRDPEVRYSQGQNPTCIARFSVAVDRKFKREGEPTADYPNIIAFGKTAEFIEKYFKKGMKIGISGRIQTGSHTNKDGQKVYTTDVVAEEVEFVEKKDADNTENQSGGFENIPEGIESDLPFSMPTR